MVALTFILYVVANFLVADDFALSHHTLHLVHDIKKPVWVNQSVCQFIALIEQEVHFDIVKDILLELVPHLRSDLKLWCGDTGWPELFVSLSLDFYGL
jgi:hypothetical protein